MTQEHHGPTCKGRYNVGALRKSTATVLADLGAIARTDSEYERRQFADIAPETVARVAREEGLALPAIPNLFHWFRCYVIIDLARIRDCIQSADIPATHRQFLLLCFAAIIRAASNADPVPVSGLEVTAHMKQRDAKGRVVNPFGLFRRGVSRAVEDVAAFQDHISAGARLSAIQGDATAIFETVDDEVECVITSPPYNIAVDYYRRHQLEMYWLGFTETQSDRLKLLPRYIGRNQIPQSHPYVADGALTTPLVKSWHSDIQGGDRRRAGAFKHYVVAMGKAIQGIARVLKPGGRAVFVVGKSRWNGRTIPTDTLFVELAGASMVLVDVLWYPVTNRYMSYRRHNEASIDKEYVLVFEKPA